MLKLGDYWYIAAASRELGRRPIHRSVEGLSLVLFRDSTGRPHALLDRCLHRGMALSGGRTTGDCIECPYHGWAYRGDGSIEAVPALCRAELPPRAKLPSFPVVEQDAHLWLWIGQGSPTRDPFHFPRHGEKGWSSFFLHTRFEAPVEACLENFLDVPHTVFVHPGLFRGDRQRPTRARIRRMSDAVEAEFLDEAPLEGFGPRLLFPRGTILKHTDRFILPSISRVDYAFVDGAAGSAWGSTREYRFIITSQCTQREDYVVDVTTAITWSLPVPSCFARPLLRWYCQRVIEQDVRVLKVLGEQVRRFGNTACYTTADLLGRDIAALRRRVAEGLERPSEAQQEIVNETTLSI